jgi:dethiobiotin synthetase
MSVLVVSGTGTGVGKSVVAAAVVAMALERGASVAYVKPAQTGVPDEPADVGAATAADLVDAADVDVVCSLARLPREHAFELSRYPHPLSPAAAARQSGRPAVSLRAVAARVRELADGYRLVVVEGAGGLLVRYDDDGGTVADLARLLAAPVLVVTSAGLGTLNHTALTLEALAHRGLDLAGLVIGAWPAEPDLAARCNVADLEMLAARPLAGAVASLAGAPEPVGRAPFADVARSGLAPALGGRFDPAEFRTAWAPRAKDAP